MTKYESSTRNGNTCHVTYVEKTRQRADNGASFKTREAVRIIGNDAQGYRIDFAGNIAGAWLPWEPVTEKVFTGKTALRDARRAVKEYAV